MAMITKEINDLEDEESGFVVISLSTGFLISFIEDVEDFPSIVPQAHWNINRLVLAIY